MSGQVAISFSSNAYGVAMDMAKTSKQAGPFIDKVVRKNGDDLLFLVKLGAAGWRGGPEIITGRYNNSIRKEESSNSMMSTVSVGTDEIYGMKLELGGVVSGPQGQIWTIQPHPHFSTAIDYLEPDFVNDLLDAVVRLPIGGRSKVK